ncbi:hypothetical protein ACLB2K_011493 [Fragaria x ananassa]
MPWINLAASRVMTSWLLDLVMLLEMSNRRHPSLELGLAILRARSASQGNQCQRRQHRSKAHASSAVDAKLASPTHAYCKKLRAFICLH